MNHLFEFKNALFYLLTLSPFLILGCTQKAIQRTQHEPAISTSQAPLSPTLDALKQFSLKELDSWITDKSPSSQKKILDALRPYIFNSKLIENPNYSGSPKLREMLRVWNETFLLSLKSNPNHPDLLKYVEAVYSGCDRSLQGCANFSFFRSDFQTAQVLLVYQRKLDLEVEQAKKQDPQTQSAEALNSAVLKYFENLYYIYDIKNSTRDPELETYYVKRASDYVDYFKLLGPNAPKSRDIHTHGKVFVTILNDFVKRKSTDPNYHSTLKTLITQFKPCTYSRKTHNPFDYGTTTILGIAAAIYQSHDPELEKCFQNAIEASQKQEDHLGSSFTQRIERLQKKSPAILTNLKLNQNLPVRQDKYFYIIDRLYRDHWNIDDASRVWETTEKNEELLLQALTIYLRFEIAGMIVETNEFMGNLYENKKKINSATLMQTAIKESAIIGNEWRQVLARFLTLETFAKRYFKRSEDRLNSQVYRDFEKMSSGWRRNIKFLSVYPNMLMLSYMMVKLNFVLKFDAWYGGVEELKADTIIKELFDNGLKPWFNFGNDNAALRGQELIYVFYYTFITDTFRTTFDKSDFDDARFFEVIFESYLNKEKTDLSSMVDEIINNFEKSNGQEKLISLCKSEKEALAKGTAPDRVYMDLSSFSNFAYVGLGSTNTHFEKTAGFYDSYGILDALKTTRLAYQEKLVFVRSILDVYEEYLKNQATNQDSTLNQRLAKARQIITEIKNKTNLLFRLVLKRHRLLSDCVYQIYETEKNVQYTLIDEEIKHLEGIHATLKSLQDSSPEDIKMRTTQFNQEINDSVFSEIYGRPTLPVEQFDKISRGYYLYSRTNLFLRFKKYLAQVKPNIEVLLPTDFKSSDFYRYGNSDKNIYSVSYDENRDTFVANALKKLNGELDSYVAWITQGRISSDTASIDHLSSKIVVMTELFKASYAGLYTLDFGNCSGSTHASSPHPESSNSEDAKGVNTFCTILESTDKLQPVTMQEIVEESLRLNEFVSLKERDIRILKKLGLNQRIPTSSFTKLFIDHKTLNSLTMLEKTYELFTEDTLFLSNIKSFYTIQSALGRFLFPPESWMEKRMYQNYVPLVTHAQWPTIEFEKAVAEREREDFAILQGNTNGKSPEEIAGIRRLSEGKIYRIDPVTLDLIYAPIDKDAEGVPIYLKREKVLDSRQIRRKFHQDTTCQFYRESDEVWDDCKK